MELTYHRKGDYLFPNLTVQDEPMSIGKYGMLRRTYLRENKKNWYQSMLMSGRLNQHLAQIDEQAENRMEELIESLNEKYPAPNKGNRTDGMGGTSEQSDRDGGRDRAEGIGVQLTADTTEQDLSEAEEEIASAFFLCPVCRPWNSRFGQSKPRCRPSMPMRSRFRQKLWMKSCGREAIEAKASSALSITL